MSTQGGHGLSVKITISTTLTAVANVLEADFPEQIKTLWAFRRHDSSDGYMERVDTGLRDLTSFTMTLLWDVAETTHAAILTAFDATTALAMSIEDPAGAEVIAFNAFIERVGRISRSEEGFQATVQVTPTGAPTIT